MKKLHTRGDTIVEVLISIAIAGFALGAAFALAQRSSLIGRSAQERVEASKLAEGQLEKLRTAAIDPAINVFDTSTNYCLDDTLAKKPIANIHDYTAYPVACVSTFYHVSINYGGSPTDLFTITVLWDDVRGQVQDSIVYYYKVHP